MKSLKKAKKGYTNVTKKVVTKFKNFIISIFRNYTFNQFEPILPFYGKLMTHQIPSQKTTKLRPCA